MLLQKAPRSASPHRTHVPRPDHAKIMEFVFIAFYWDLFLWQLRMCHKSWDPVHTKNMVYGEGRGLQWMRTARFERKILKFESKQC